MDLVLDWVIEQGGVEAISKVNQQKAKLLYDVIDQSDTYQNNIDPKYRSQMNVVFHLATPELEARFVAEAAEQGMIGLKGHRVVGGIRASIYNAMPLAGVEKLASFMREFNPS